MIRPGACLRSAPHSAEMTSRGSTHNSIVFHIDRKTFLVPEQPCDRPGKIIQRVRKEAVITGAVDQDKGIDPLCGQGLRHGIPLHQDPFPVITASRADDTDRSPGMTAEVQKADIRRAGCGTADGFILHLRRKRRTVPCSGLI